ncbi:RHS repeat-associated core domain-containing protein [Pseudomonas sp. RP23018S]|uniref:RHS repeat-associated core domain-containing protein n=1 Tax=Pseudomonas sp. RP23018S TaxID=3096037 RepID=UPI003A102792
MFATSVYSPYGHHGSALYPSFSGERYDPCSRTYLLGQGFRGYSPALMRFLAVDSLSPFGRGGLNAYAYCAGDPVNFVDPTGQFSKEMLISAKAQLKPFEKRHPVSPAQRSRSPERQHLLPPPPPKTPTERTKKFRFANDTKYVSNDGIPVKQNIFHARRKYMALANTEFEKIMPLRKKHRILTSAHTILNKPEGYDFESLMNALKFDLEESEVRMKNLLTLIRANSN